MNESENEFFRAPPSFVLPSRSQTSLAFEITNSGYELDRQCHHQEFKSTSSVIYQKIDDDYEDEETESSTLTQAKQNIRERNTYSSMDSFENLNNLSPTPLNSILITPLNRDYKTPHDIDVKILTPMQINSLISHTQSHTNLSRSKTVEFLSISDNALKRLKRSSVSTECQTDFKLDPFVTKSIPCLSELESIDIYYSSLNDSFHLLTEDQFETDECETIELYRRDCKGKRRPLPADRLVCSSTQTVLSARPDTNRSTQTSPTLLRNYLAIEDSKSQEKPFATKPCLKPIHRDLDYHEEIANKVEHREDLFLTNDDEVALFQVPIIQPAAVIKHAEILQNTSEILDESSSSSSRASIVDQIKENTDHTSDDSIDEMEAIEPKLEKYKVEIHKPIIDTIGSTTREEAKFIEQETSNGRKNHEFESNWQVKNKSISFNDELDVIEPSDTATTSTSNIGTQSNSQIDNLNELIKEDQDLSKIEESIKKEEPTKSTSSISFSNNWDNMPVKPYNSNLQTKLQFESSLKRKLKHFDLKEVSATRFDAKSNETKPAAAKSELSNSNSFKTRLRANGFDSFGQQKLTQNVIHTRIPSPPRRPPPPIPISPPVVYPKFDEEKQLANDNISSTNSSKSTRPLVLDCYEEIQEALTITKTSIINTTTIIKQPPTEISNSEPVFVKLSPRDEPPKQNKGQTKVSENDREINDEALSLSTIFIENNFEIQKQVTEEAKPLRRDTSVTSSSSRLILPDDLDPFEINLDDYAEKESNEEMSHADSSFEKLKILSEASHFVVQSDELESNRKEIVEKLVQDDYPLVLRTSQILLSDDENKFEINLDEYAEKETGEEQLQVNSLQPKLVTDVSRIILSDDENKFEIDLDEYSENNNVPIEPTKYLIEDHQTTTIEQSQLISLPKIIYEYIEESDLSKDTQNIEYGQLANETFVFFSNEANRRFIILPQNWRENDELPYISEEDIDFSQWIIHQEEGTNRAFLRDESSSHCYYIVPTNRALMNPSHDTIRQQEKITYRTEYSDASTATTSIEEKSLIKFEFVDTLLKESRSRNISTSSRLNIVDDLEKFEIDFEQYDEHVNTTQVKPLTTELQLTRKSSTSLSKLIIDDEIEKFSVDVNLDAYNEEPTQSQVDLRGFGYERNVNVGQSRHKNQPNQPLKLYKSWNNLNDVLGQEGESSDRDEKYSTDADVEENDENEAPKAQMNENSLVSDDDRDQNKKLSFIPKTFDAEIFHVSVSSVRPPAGIFDLNPKNLTKYTETYDLNEGKFTNAAGLNPSKKFDKRPNILKKKILAKKEAISLSDLAKLDAKLRQSDSTSVLTETSVDNLSIDLKRSELTKMQKLMISLAEEEYEKVKRRIELRNKRMPEILIEIETAKARERKKLEDELNLLMRKAKYDDEFIQKCQNKSFSESSLIEELRRSKLSPSPRPSLGARESGYSSDESGYSSKKQKFSSYESMPKLGVLTDDISESGYEKILTRTPILQAEFVTEKLANDALPREGAEKLPQNRTASNDRQQSSSQSASQMSNLLPSIFRSRREDDDENDDGRKRNRQTREDEPQNLTFRIEFINEDELENNYSELYDIKVDPVSGESIIFDFDKKIKYIIVKKPLKIQDQLYYSYADRSWLDELESDNVRISSVNGEFYVQDAQKRRWIILPDNWRESDVYPYVSANDVDPQEWTIYEDDESDRKYIVDDKTGRRYYLVPDLSQADFDQFIKQLRVETKKESSKQNFQYITRSEAAKLKVKLQVDSSSGETYFNDPAKLNIRWIVLPDDWKESESCPYLNEEDVDLNGFKIYTENDSNRRFVVDDESGVKYYLVPVPNQSLLSDLNPYKTTELDKLIKNLIKQETTEPFVPKPVGKKNQIVNASQLSQPKSILRVKDDTKKEDIQVCYVTEDELIDFDLSDIELKEDPVTEEPYVMDKFVKNKKWVIIPSDWKELETSPYISEEDIKVLQWENKVQKEEGSNRKYIIDDESGSKFFIVPEEVDFRETFKYQWSAISALVPKVPEKRDDVPASIDNNPEVRTQRSRQSEKANRLKHEFVSKRQAAFLTGPKRFTFKYRDKLIDPQILPRSPRPLHHLLFDDQDLKRELRLIPDDFFTANESDKENLILDKPDRNDPTYQELDADGKGSSLDRRKLTDIEIYGYGKQFKMKKSASQDALMHKLNESEYQSLDAVSKSQFLDGVLTERFKENKIYQRTQRGTLRSAKSLQLQEQILATPRSQKNKWTESLNRSDRMKPRIILINDEEKILSADKNCKVYVQYYYDYESVLGVDPAYLLMIPNRGPTNPTRPLEVTPKQLIGNQHSSIALREAPVFVYHSNGNAYFENLAQYLAGEHAKLSPKTVKKMLQFASMNEFEKYLESKITREQAERISKLYGGGDHKPIELDTLKRDFLKTISNNKQQKTYYHPNCEHDSLRNEDNGNIITNQTQDVDINGVILRSTFVNLRPNRIERLPQQKEKQEQDSEFDLPKLLVPQEQRPITLKALIKSKNQSNTQENVRTKPIIPQDQSNNLLSKLNRFKVK